MEEHLNPLTVTHLLQHTLRSLCTHQNSEWVYAVFWRILPRNFPPPKWDGQGGAYDRSRGNRRNWILAWEDGYCNFGASATGETNTSEYSRPSVYGNCEPQHLQGLQPELFFKMSHEIYNFGEGLIGKVASDHNHKWIHKEPAGEQQPNLLSAWYNSSDSHPRTWEAQFQSGIKTIALIAVREGVVQLGAMQKVTEDLSYVMTLRRKFSLIESIPGALLPHPSSSAFPYKAADGYFAQEMWQHQGAMAPPLEYGSYCHEPFNQQPPPMAMKITPSMSSLENLLSKLPSVVPSPFQQAADYSEMQQYQHPLMATPSGRPLDFMGCSVGVAAKGEDEEGRDDDAQDKGGGGECSSSMTSYHQHNFSYHQDLNSRPDNGF